MLNFAISCNWQFYLTEPHCWLSMFPSIYEIWWKNNNQKENAFHQSQWKSAPKTWFYKTANEDFALLQAKNRLKTNKSETAEPRPPVLVTYPSEVYVFWEKQAFSAKSEKTSFLVTTLTPCFYWITAFDIPSHT